MLLSVCPQPNAKHDTTLLPPIIARAVCLLWLSNVHLSCFYVYCPRFTLTAATHTADKTGELFV